MVTSLVSKNSATSDLRRRIVEAAWRLGNDGGDDALTIRNIAAQVGISPALLYTYFEGKAALMLEMQRRAAPQLDEELARAIDGNDGPNEALFRLCVAYVEFAREHRWLYTMTSRELASGAANRSSDAFIVRATTLLVAREGHPGDDPAIVALQLRIALGGLADNAPAEADSRTRALSSERRSFVEGYVRMLLRGV